MLRGTSGGGSPELEEAIICMPARVWGSGSLASELSVLLHV